MKRYHFVVAVCLSTLVGCGGGGSGSGSGGTTTPVVTGTPNNLAGVTIVYDQSPRLNTALKVSLQSNTSNTPDDYDWKVISQPASANLQLNVAANSQSVSLTPWVAGQYKISATSSDGDILETQFSVVSEFAVNETKIEDFDATQSLSKQAGIVSNQAWVYSTTLSRASIESIVANYNSLSVVGFDEIRGLLVEFDETTAQSQTEINTLKTISGIESVGPRVFVGSDFIHPPLKIADDGSAFDDGGDNWHLEEVGIESAWDVTTGSSDYLIGVLDSGFDPQHEDLRGRFKETTASVDALVDADGIAHGTAVAGAIGAITDNNKGVSGVNWSNQLVGGKAKYDDLNNVISKEGVLLSNNSWSLIPRYIAQRFDPDSANSVEEINRISLAQTGDFRKLVTEYSTKLFIFGAGNGIANGAGNDNGVFGVDGRHGSPALQYEEQDGAVVLAKKDNVLFVAAHLIDNRLPYYSNYGESVEIAAPTGFKAPKRDIDVLESFDETDEYYTGSDYGTNSVSNAGFTGTSAASPIVTGVASLILSADPTLTASQVKTILIRSATASISERYTTPFKDAAGNFETATLANPIPKLNAAAALEMVKDIAQAKDVVVEHMFSDPFKGIVTVNVSLANSDIEIDSFDYIASVKKNGSFEQFLDGTVAGFSPLVFQNLDPNNTNYKITGITNVAAHQPTKIPLNSDFSYEFLVPKVNALSSDKDTLARIPNVSLDIKSEDGSLPLNSGTTNANGSSRLYLTPGKYTIIAKADGYKDLTKSVNLKNTDLELDIILELEPNTTESDPNTGADGENLQPITPLTTTETSTVPNVVGIPNVTSLTITEEGGFNGSIDQDFNLIEGVTAINAVDIQRDIGISVICDSGSPKPITLNAADFSAGTIDETYYDDGQQVASCRSNYSSILPITLTGSTLFQGVLEDWGSEDMQLSTNCPTGSTPTTTPTFSDTTCTSIVVENYLITDVNGVEHKVSKRLTTVPNE